MSLASVWKRRAWKRKPLSAVIAYGAEHVWVEVTVNDVTGFNAVFGHAGKPALCSPAIIPKMVIQIQPFNHDEHEMCRKCAELMAQTNIPAGTVIGTMTATIV